VATGSVAGMPSIPILLAALTALAPSSATAAPCGTTAVEHRDRHDLAQASPRPVSFSGSRSPDGRRIVSVRWRDSTGPLPMAHIMSTPSR
jgi:hypothetical protein